MSHWSRWSLLLLLSLPSVCFAVDDHPWNNLAGLHPGDRIRVRLATGKCATGLFESWTPERIVFNSDSRGRLETNREDARRIDRFRPGAWSRSKTALVGGGIGFAGGFTVGAAVGGCHRGWAFCVPRAGAGGIVGGVGLVLGVGIGAAVPHHSTDILYRRQ